jgi:hypothetical protein
MPEISYDTADRHGRFRLWWWRHFCPSKHWIVRFHVYDIGGNEIHHQDELFLGPAPDDMTSADMIRIGPIDSELPPWKLEIEWPNGNRQLLARFDEVA